MAEQNVSGGKLARLKQMLFFLCLLVFTLASLVLLSASPAPEGSTVPFSLGVLLDGTFLEQNGIWSGLLERDALYDNQIPPQLLLMGGQEIQVETGSAFTEPGYFAQDARYQELTRQVKVWAEGDKILYEVTDSLGNSTRRSRTISYADTTPPEIRLTGAAEMHLQVGEEYTEPGYTARDSADGILTDQVIVSGTVDPTTPGTYVLTYTVRDSTGNQTIQRRTIHVDTGDGLPLEGEVYDAAAWEEAPEAETPEEEAPPEETPEPAEETPAPTEEPSPEPTPAETAPAVGFTETDAGM